MKNLKIDLYKNYGEKPEKAIIIPFSALPVAIQFLLPNRVKSALEKAGIDLMQCKELAKEKELKGRLIEIENPGEKLVISVE